ncbi:MAG: PA domain-containing protein [Stenotrophomonas sp.]|uniref:PA domain-containing protein n=1 Tax=Stenotrophomonas sp. TaxID=69392 RepID=UPI003D6D3865
MKTSLLCAVVGASLFAATAQAAVITPVNQDPANKGLNDPSPRAPEGGNPGKTVGEQRRLVYQFAADLWGSVLQSEVETRVGASFQDLECTATGGVLGSAGPTWVGGKDPTATEPGMLAHGALANAIEGKRLSAAATDITSRFNANLGGRNPNGTACMTGSGWYYGLDGKTPAGQINFLDVVMHEIGHGLGFSGFVGYTSGVLGERTGAFQYRGYSDVYTHNAFDNLTGKRFDDPSMTNAMRATSIRTRGAPAWDGANTKAQTALWLDPAIVLSIPDTTPAVASQFFGTASFGPAATPENFSGPLAIANDATGTDTADACEALPAGSLTGKIAFINRGTCAFEIKAFNAQTAGAVAAIIGNVASSGDPGTAPGMAEDASVEATIPTVSVNLADAQRITTALNAGTALTASLGKVAGQMAGADAAGRALLYAPAAVASGSSFSHFESVLIPDALMEPANSDNTDSARIVDLSLAIFADEGWVLNNGNARIGTCDTGVKLFKNPGLIAGANVQAQDRLCRVSANGNRSLYLRCMNDTAADLKAVGMVSSVEQAGIRSCAAKVITP